ncbi:hypothetical protein HUJ04_008468 [Dendroctonus ponderosae]|nr:hypothetical protein HUJ04_008468 [Dendroctonus ponderosae]
MAHFAINDSSIENLRPSLSLGCGLITFVSALSETLAEIYEYHKDGPNGPDFNYRYGWCFFTAATALILAYVSSAFSFVGYLNRYTSTDDMVGSLIYLNSLMMLTLKGE